MLTPESVRELNSSWFPNLTDAGLDRLIGLLEADSPFLVRGCFGTIEPMGCLATHAGWHHPRTSHLSYDAGVRWLHHVAGLNPATSNVIRQWDEAGPRGLVLRFDLLRAFKEEHHRRQAPAHADELVAV